MVIIDAVIRLVPGVLGDEGSAADESHSLPGRIEYPQRLLQHPGRLGHLHRAQAAGAATQALMAMADPAAVFSPDEIERLWQQVKPLYDKLHCFVRSNRPGAAETPLPPPGPKSGSWPPPRPSRCPRSATSRSGRTPPRRLSSLPTGSRLWLRVI